MERNLCQKTRSEKKHYTEEYSSDLGYFAHISAMQKFKNNCIVQLRMGKWRPTGKLGIYKHVRLKLCHQVFGRKAS